MSDPTFIPLLNSIAVNERKGEVLLSAWADTTADESLAAALRFVAIREGEHAWAFTKRLCELGHPVCEETAFQVFKDFDALLAFIRSDASDAEKVGRLRGDPGAERKDPFARFFDDVTIDPVTGALLGRYIAEERDSGRRLEAEYARICPARTKPADPASRSDIEDLKACISALQAEVAELKRLRSVA